MKTERYRKEDNIYCIDVKIHQLKQIYNEKDPAPFRYRDLDDDFVDYVVSSAEEFSIKTPLKLVLHVSDEALPEASKEEAGKSISEYFAYEQELQRKKLKKIIKRGQFFLFLGIIGLLVCLILSEIVLFYDPNTKIGNFISHGFIIAAWVALWRPIELILYDWWPCLDKIKVFRKLKDVSVVIP